MVDIYRFSFVAAMVGGGGVASVATVENGNRAFPTGGKLVTEASSFRLGKRAQCVHAQQSCYRGGTLFGRQNLIVCGQIIADSLPAQKMGKDDPITPCRATSKSVGKEFTAFFKSQNLPNLLYSVQTSMRCLRVKTCELCENIQLWS